MTYNSTSLKLTDGKYFLEFVLLLETERYFKQNNTNSSVFNLRNKEPST